MNRVDLRKEVQRGYDIRGIHIENPEYVKCVQIIIGAIKVAEFKNLKDLETFPVYLTLCQYMTVHLDFLFTDDAPKEFVEEEVTHRIFGETVTVYDEDTDTCVTGPMVEITRKLETVERVILPKYKIDTFVSNIHGETKVTVDEGCTLWYKNSMAGLIYS